MEEKIINEKIIKENRLLEGFKRFVIEIKQSDENTVTNEGDIFSYITKSGKQKKYKCFQIADVRPIYLRDKILYSKGFIFKEIKE